jgi:nucleotide-binding universal stress UspA family protein
VLQKAAIKVSLREPRSKFLEMMETLRILGTSTIHLIHVDNGSGSGIAAKKERLEELAAEVRNMNFNVSTIFERGHAPTRITNIAKDLDVDYLVIYWLPKAFMTQAIMGSIDIDIIRLSKMPIFIYNRSYINAGSGLDRVLYATDFMATDAKVMPHLIKRNLPAREVFLLHVGNRAPDPKTEQMRRTRIMDNLKRLAAECRSAYSAVHTLEVVGRRQTQILRQSALNKVDLIVIGKSDNPKPLKNLAGSLAEVLPRRAKRSVFIVPGYY